MVATNENHPFVQAVAKIFSLSTLVVDQPTTCRYGHADIFHAPSKKERALLVVIMIMMEQRRLCGTRTHVVLDELLGIDAFTHELWLVLILGDNDADIYYIGAIGAPWCA